MYRQGPDGLAPDDFAHEQTMVVVHGEELAVFSSCSHAGADTVVEEVKAAFPGKSVRAFFGGFHLMGAGGASTLGVRPERPRPWGSGCWRWGWRRFGPATAPAGPPLTSWSPFWGTASTTWPPAPWSPSGRTKHTKGAAPAWQGRLLFTFFDRELSGGRNTSQQEEHPAAPPRSDAHPRRRRKKLG